MTERTVKLTNLTLEMTYDTENGQFHEVSLKQEKFDLNLRVYPEVKNGLLLRINPRGEGWGWNQGVKK